MICVYHQTSVYQNKTSSPKIVPDSTMQKWELPRYSAPTKMLEKEQVISEFRDLDLAGDGKLKFLGLRGALELKDVTLSDEALRSWLRESDRHGKGFVDLNDYLALYGYGKSASETSFSSTKQQRGDELAGLLSINGQRSDVLLKRAFAKYDTDGDGFISVQDLRELVNWELVQDLFQGVEYTDKELVNWVKKRDISGVGAVSFEDFFNFFNR